MNFFSLTAKPLGTVAMNLIPRKGSWGGANQWTTQLTKYFKAQGWKVRYDLKRPVDVIMMTHTGISGDTSFGLPQVTDFKKKYPQVPCVHRINDNDRRKGNEGKVMQIWLQQSNTVADHTVFVSEWLRDHHTESWFDTTKSHSVITPGADEDVFYPLQHSSYHPGGKLRLVTHHWSDNWNKGFDVYQQIDELLATQKNPEFELWIIGRWPAEIQWKVARTFPPASGMNLADLLHQCHGYVSASRYEPGAMHVAEGLQCGLPILYHRDSGGTVEQGERYGLEIQDDLGKTLALFKKQYAALRANLLAAPPSGTKMASEYFQLAQELIAKS